MLCWSIEDGGLIAPSLVRPDLLENAAGELGGDAGKFDRAGVVGAESFCGVSVGAGGTELASTVVVSGSAETGLSESWVSPLLDDGATALAYWLRDGLPAPSPFWR